MSGACPKCAGAMEQGFTIDAGDDLSAPKVASWHGGAPRKSTWFGLRTLEEDKREIAAWRCSGCGFLEMYAP